MKTDTTTGPDPLDTLAAQAGASLTNPPLGEGSTDLDVAAAAGQTAPEVTNEQALSGAIMAAREAFCMFTKLESPRQTLADETVTQLAGLWAPVLTKHGINLGKYLGDYAAEVAAVLGTFAIAAAVRSGVQAELAKRKPSEPVEAPAASVGPDSLDAGRAE